MKKAASRLLICVITLSLVTIYTSKAQTIHVQITEPVDVAACDSNRFQASFTATTTFSVKISPRIITGNQSPFSLTCQDTLPVFPIKLIADTAGNPNISEAVFQPSDSSWVIDVLDTGLIVFDYFVLIDCSIVQESTFNNSLYLLQSWTCEGCSLVFDLDSSATNQHTSANIKSPRIIDISNTNFSASYNNASSLIFEYKNNGNYQAAIQFTFNPDLLGTNCAAVISDSLQYGIKDSTGAVSTWTTLIPNDWTLATIPINLSLVVRNSIRVWDCLDLCVTQKTGFEWQCAFTDTTDTLLCNKCQDEYIGTYTVYTDSSMKARLLMERLDPTYAEARYDHSCSGTFVHWRFRLSNQGVEDIPVTNLALFYYGQQDRYSNLSLIPFDSLNFDLSGCPSCSIDTIVEFAANSLCVSDVPDPLKRWDALIRELGGGEFIEFSFATYKCLEYNDTLWNSIKNFNQWIITYDGIDSCGLTVDKALASPVNTPFQSFTGAISTHQHSASYDLDLALEFTPTVTDITVPKDSIFGPSVNLAMNLKGMFPTPHDYQILGCNLPDSATCQIQGYLRAEVHCQTGLRIENIYTDAYLNHLTLGTMLPVYAYQTNILDTCLEGYYYFYFDLNDPIAMDMINSGQFHFQLQSCCGNPNAEPTEYSVGYSLMPNPDTCFVLDTTLVSLNDPPVCTNCPEWLPLSSESHFIFVHCPGCRAPGIIIDSYKMERLTYGLEDGDNNRLADSTLTVIEKDSLYFSTHPVRSFVSMHGDMIQDLMVAHFEPGVLPDSTDPTGYTYSQMITSPNTAVLDYLQLSRRIGESSALSMDLHPLEMYLYIDVPDTTSTGCIDCDQFQMPSINFKTIQINYADTSSIGTFLNIISDSLDNYYFYSFDVDSLGPQTLFQHRTIPDSSEIFTGFFESQQYRLRVVYQNCGNFLPSNLVTPDNEDGFRESVMSHNMWLSGIDQGYNAYSYDSLMPYTLPLIIDSSFANGYLFICEVFGGLHYFVSNSAYNRTVFQAFNNLCNRQLWSEGVSYIGGNGFIDRFPYEFRSPVLHAESFQIQSVPGFIRSNPRIVTTFTDAILTPGSSLTLDLPVTIPPYPAAITITSNDYPNISCATQIPVALNDSNLYSGDQAGTIRLIMDLIPDTCQIGYTFEPDTSFSMIQFTDFSSDCGSVTDTTFCGAMVQTSFNIVYPELKLPYPLLSLSINDSVGYTGQVCWDITYANPLDSVPGTYGLSTSAPNVFLYVPDSITLPNLTNWQMTMNGNTTFPDTNGFFHISPNMAASNSGQINGQLCATVNLCEDMEGVQILWGWNCLNYPTDPDSLCYFGIDTLDFSPPIANLDAPGKIYQPPYTLCDTLNFGAEFISTNHGSVFTDSLFLIDMPAFLNITSVSISDCSGGGNTISLNSSFSSWQITDSMLLQLGYTNGLLNYRDTLCVDINAILDCGFQELANLPDIVLSGHDLCGDPKNGSANFNNYELEIDSSICSTCFTVTKTASQDTVIALTDTVTYTITVCANNAGPQAISLTEYLPVDFNVIFSNFPTTDTIPGDTCLVYTVTGTFAFGGNCTQSCNSVLVSTPNVTVVDTVCITVLPSCFSWSYTLIPDSALSSSYPSTISNDTLFISGVFFIDSTFTLSNCVVYANACAQIVVLAPASLILDSTLIEGCDQMWQGIYLNSYSRIGVQKHSTIRDANIAIFVNDRTELKIINSALEDFIKGIYVPPNNSGFNSIIFQAVYGNRFGLFGSALKTPYLGQAAFGTIPRSGIEVNDVVWHLNYAAADSNYFYNMNKGVTGYRSKLTVENNKFSTIIPDAFYTDPWDGSAISSLGDQGTGWAGSLTVVPVTSGAPTIESSEVGVHTDYSYLDISNVHMTDMGTGVFTSNCIYMLHTNVVNNVIEARDFGINWMLNIGAKKMNADNNNIYMTGASSIGISMKEGTVAATANYSVTNNYINNDGGDAGIFGQSLLQANIRHNIVDIGNNTTSQMSGIAINGNESSQISCNSIKGDGVSATDTLQHGIHVSISNYCDVSCNNTDSTGWGIFFGGICAQTSFSGNYMDDHFEGLRLNNVAVIDTQSHAGNHWTGNYGNFGAVNFNASSFLQLAKSLFEVDTSATFLPLTPDGINPAWPDNVGWFDPIPGTEYSCSDSSVCDDSRHRESSEDFKMMIAEDSTITSDFIPESKSIAKEFLYQELKNNSAAISNISLSDFVSVQSSTSLGYLYEANKALSEARINNLIATTLDSNSEQISLYIDSLFYFDSLQVINPLTSFSSQRESIINQLNNLNSLITNLLNQQQSNIDLKLTIASQQNNLVQPSEIPEENQKFINNIEILFRNGGKNAIQIYLPQIHDISEQCPYKGGASVYKARTFATLLGENVNYDDQNVCASQGIYRSNQVINFKFPKIKIIPNPANDFIDILLYSEASNYSEIEIHDAVGKIVYKKNSAFKNVRINISKLVPGVYSVEVKINNDKLHEKFVIVR